VLHPVGIGAVGSQVQKGRNLSILLSGASNRHQVIKLSSNNGGNVTVTSSVSEGPAHAVKLLSQILICPLLVMT